VIIIIIIDNIMVKTSSHIKFH